MASVVRALLPGRSVCWLFPTAKVEVRATSSGTRCLSQETGTKEQPLTLIQQTDGIRTICLNNPRKRNALSLAMLESLKKDLTFDSEDLRVIILTSKGPVFSTGHDLKELTSSTGRTYHSQVFKTCTEVMTLLQELPVPVIAKVRGLATAAGCQLVASCDLAVASENAQFATPGVSVGLFCSTPAVAVGRSVPRKVAMEMLLTGHPISAHAALQHGLISRIVPDDQLDAQTVTIARRICEMSKSTLSLGKSCFYSQIAMDRKSAYRFSEQVMVDNLSLEDGQEGIKAFFQKRTPKWTHNSRKIH